MNLKKNRNLIKYKFHKWKKKKTKTKYKNGIRDTDIIFLVELKKRVHPNNAYQALKASTLLFYFPFYKNNKK